MKRQTTLELYRETMSFSSGHFMIFSATEREHLHGHNYRVHAAFTFSVGQDGLNFNCQHYLDKLSEMCARLNRYFLLPTESRYLRIEEKNDSYYVYFNQEVFTFLRAEVILLPLTNVSMEELSWWFLEQFRMENDQLITDHGIEKIVIKVFSAPGICASSHWERGS
jgi:6-pyruvoyltetrahydropterin/6-carboxytetrahydropterin synthase